MNNPVERWLRLLIKILPDGGTVTLDRDALLEVLEDAAPPREEVQDAGGEVEIDYTLEDVGKLYNRAPNTVRDWCKKRGLRHYKDAAGRIRITRQALEEWQEGQREGKAKREDPLDLSSWRDHLRNTG